MAEFCEDPQNMDEMGAFIDEILNKAQAEATIRLEQKNKVRANFFSQLTKISDFISKIKLMIFFIYSISSIDWVEEKWKRY